MKVFLKILLWVAIIALVIFLVLFLTVKIAASPEFSTIPELIQYLIRQITGGGALAALK